MKVVLLKDVKKLGRAGEVVSTADGHAINFLIPAKFAVIATRVAIKEAGIRSAQLSTRKELDAKLLQQNIASLRDAKIIIKAKVNEKGHLYDAIGKDDITAAARAQANIDLPAACIELERPIKEIGTFTIVAKNGEVSGEFSITIESE